MGRQFILWNVGIAFININGTNFTPHWFTGKMFELNVCNLDYGDLLRSPEMSVLVWLTDYLSICLDEEKTEYLTQVSRSSPICDSNSWYSERKAVKLTVHTENLIFRFCWPSILVRLWVIGQLDAQLRYYYYYHHHPPHVWSNTVLIIRRSDCINTTSGVVFSDIVTVRCSHRTVTISDAVLIQFDLLMMSTVLLETCRGL